MTVAIRISLHGFPEVFIDRIECFDGLVRDMDTVIRKFLPDNTFDFIGGFDVRNPNFLKTTSQSRRKSNTACVRPRNANLGIHRGEKTEIGVNFDLFPSQRIGKSPFVKIFIQDLNKARTRHIRFFKNKDSSVFHSADKFADNIMEDLGFFVPFITTDQPLKRGVPQRNGPVSPSQTAAKITDHLGFSASGLTNRHHWRTRINKSFQKSNTDQVR